MLPKKRKDLPAYTWKICPILRFRDRCKAVKRYCSVYLLIYLCGFLFSINQVDSCGKASSTPKCCFRYPAQKCYISLLNMILSPWESMNIDPVVGGFCKVMKMWWSFFSIFKLSFFLFFRHDNQTGRWLTNFRATWDPKFDSYAVIGSMRYPRQVLFLFFTCNSRWT